MISLGALRSQIPKKITQKFIFGNAANRIQRATVGRLSTNVTLMRESIEEKDANPTQGSWLKSSFQNYFSLPKSTSFIDAPSGSFIELEESDIKRFLPEDFAGDLAEEFSYSGKSEWMVRDSGKLLCRLIDNFENKKGSSQSSNELGAAVSIPGFTDRPEWLDSVIRVAYFNEDLIQRPKPTKRTKSMDLERTGFSFVNECMQKIMSKEEKPTKILLTGERGAGKSVALNQAVLHARKNGWLCMFVPKAWEQVQLGSYLEPMNEEETYFCNPFLTVDVLRGFLQAHSDILRELPITNTEINEKLRPIHDAFLDDCARSIQMLKESDAPFVRARELVHEEDRIAFVDEKDRDVLANFNYRDFTMETLEDLALFGVAHRDISGHIFETLVHELRQVDSVPVLFAVDEYNSWEVHSAFTLERKVVHSQQLCVPRALRFISDQKAETEEWSMKRGMCIAATSLFHPEVARKAFKNTRGSIPLTINVPLYNQVEFLSALSHYANVERISDNHSIQDVRAFRTQVSSVPRLARQQVDAFMFERTMSAVGFSAGEAEESEGEEAGEGYDDFSTDGTDFQE